MTTMTLDEIARDPKVYVTPCEMAPHLKCDPYSINLTAKAGRLSLPHFWSGNRLRVSKAAFLEFCGYKISSGGSNGT